MTREKREPKREGERERENKSEKDESRDTRVTMGLVAAFLEPK